MFTLSPLHPEILPNAATMSGLFNDRHRKSDTGIAWEITPKLCRSKLFISHTDADNALNKAENN